MSHHPARHALPRDPQQTLDDFFTRWVGQHRVIATVEGGLEFQEARRAWAAAREMARFSQITNEQLAKSLKYHKAMHEKYIKAYQDERCKHIGDYTRMFVRRPRMRKLVRHLMSL